MSLNFLLGCFGWQPSKMPKSNETTTRIWLWAFKIVMIIPTAVTAFEARKRYLIVKDIPELQRPPYDEHVLLAHLLTYVSTILILPWIFISSLTLIWKRLKGPWILVYGLLDFAIALTLAVGVGFQANYLPATTGRCSNAEAWQVVGTNKSFFSQVAEHDVPTSAGQHCKNFVSAWTLAVAILFFQMLVSYIGIFFDEREHSLLNPFRPLFYFIFAIIGPPFFFHTHVLPKVRFTWRFVVKLYQQLRMEKLEFEELSPYVPKYEHIVVSNPKLQRILTIEHVLLELVNNLHYEEVINLGLASKAVREAVFPGRDLEHRVPKLKKACCDKDTTKKSCPYCNKIICCNCKDTRFWPGMPGLRHVTMCKPYCRKCYYRYFSRHTRVYKKPCKCNTTDRSHELQDMCKTCALKDTVQTQTARHKRYQQEARDIAMGTHLKPGEMVKCGSCQSELKSGTRWWVCGKCNGECRDSIHPPFVGKRKEVDIDKVEKQDGDSRETGSLRWSKWMAAFSNR